MKKKFTGLSSTATGVENDNATKGEGTAVVSSSIKDAIDNIHAAQEQIAAFARERATQQLSTGSLAAISRDMDQIVRRMSVYVKN